MQNQLVGWLGLVVFVLAVGATVAADFFRQQDIRSAAAGTTSGDAVAARVTGGRVFWLTVASVVLAVIAAVATVIRLATLA